MADKPKIKPKSKWLGTGMAEQAAEAFSEKARKERCISDGGKWVDGKCMKEEK